MSQPQQIKYPEPKILRRLVLWAPDPASAARERAQMTFAVKGYNLEILVWTKGENDKGKGPIRANMSMLQIMTLCDNLRFVAQAPEKCVADLPVSGLAPKDPNNREAKREIIDQALVRVSKNTDGVVSIAVFDKRDETRSRILFPFMLDRYTGIVNRNGEPLGEDGVSKMVAESYAKILSDTFIRNMEITSNEENQANYGDRDDSNFKKKSNNSAPRQEAKTDFNDISY